MKSVRHEFLVLGGFGLLALLFTWPLILNFNSAVPGEDHRDAWQMVWNLWWVRYALEHAQNPFYTNLMFYPQGTDLHLHALNAFNGLLSLPVQYVAAWLGGAANGAVAGYNFIVLFSLTVGAYGGFCLARYLWGNWQAALVGGLGYGFSSYIFDHLLGHLNLVSAEFIPFYILFFLKALHNEQSWFSKSTIYAVLSLLITTFLELQYILYLAIFSGLYLLYITLLKIRRGLTKQPNFNLLRIYGQAALIAFVYGLLSLPFTVPMLFEALSNPNTVPQRQEKLYSADLLAYFYPSPFQPLWGNFMSQAIKPFKATLIEKVVFPSFTLYGLILAGLILNLVGQKSTIGKISAAGKWFWLGLALIFAVLSFGPVLHINGVETNLPLPAAIIYKIPLLNITRVPSRFAVIAILALSLTAAWALTLILSRTKWQSGLTILVLFILAFELLPAPYPLTYYKVSDFYQRLAIETENEHSIMDIPLNYGRFQYETSYLQAQMTHHKPLLNGYISRNPVFAPYNGLPVFSAFRDLIEQEPPDILPVQPLDVGILRYFKVRYLAIHKDILSDKERDRMFGLISQLLPNQEPLWDDANLTVYEIPTGQAVDFFYNVEPTGWYGVEKIAGGGYSRWVNGATAQIDLWSATTRQVELEFLAWSFRGTNVTEFWLNGKLLESTQLATDPKTIQIKLDLASGQNKFVIKVRGRSYNPKELGLSQDDRWLSISIGNVKFR